MRLNKWLKINLFWQKKILEKKIEILYILTDNTDKNAFIASCKCKNCVISLQCVKVSSLRINGNNCLIFFN